MQFLPPQQYENTSVQEYDYLLKFVITGESSVGKSALLLRFSENLFVNTWLATIGVDFKVRNLVLGDKNGLEKRVKLQLWDTAGQERFRTIINTYYRGCHAVMLTYDVTNRESFDKIEDWYDDILKQTGNKKVEVLLVGNKNDLTDERQVSYDEGLEMAQQLGCEFVETSAKTAMNVSQAFESLALKCVKQFMLAANVERMIQASNSQEANEPKSFKANEKELGSSGISSLSNSSASKIKNACC